MAHWGSRNRAYSCQTRGEGTGRVGRQTAGFYFKVVFSHYRLRSASEHDGESEVTRNTACLAMKKPGGQKAAGSHVLTREILMMRHPPSPPLMLPRPCLTGSPAPWGPILSDSIHSCVLAAKQPWRLALAFTNSFRPDLAKSGSDFGCCWGM